MRITCLGGAGTVTGSSYLVENEEGVSFLVDCGLFQGGRQMEARNWQVRSDLPTVAQAIFITHAHIDHSGLVPRLVRQGYKGPIYSSKATCELLKILWLDCAHIQEMEAEWQSRKNKRQGRQEVEVLYETADAEAAGRLLVPLDMACHQSLLPGVEVCFYQAGHILGAASLYINLDGAEGRRRVIFSGDLGRPGQLIVPDPVDLPLPDMAFMETTYGNRLHKTLTDSQAELLAVIKQAYQEKGKVVIPAFAVERTQEIIYTLAAAYRRGEMPKDMPVFLDSPLAINATRIFRAHPEFFDQETQDILAEGNTPLNFPNLKFTPSTEESREINNYAGPAVIIAGNGMATAGRVKHHLKHNLWRPNCHVVIVGFQAKGSTGRRLVEGATRVKIFREDVAVKAKVHTIGGFSAHADQNELLHWLTGIAHPGLKVNLVHGESTSSQDFKKLAQERFPQVQFHIPRWQEVLRLAPARPVAEPAPAAPAAPRVGAEQVRGLKDRLTSLLTLLEAGGTEFSPQQAAALEGKMAEVERLLKQAEAA